MSWHAQTGFARLKVAVCLQGVTFACINAAAVVEDAAGKKEEGGTDAVAPVDAAPAPKLATFALRIKQLDVLEQFIAAVNEHKVGGKKGDEEAPDP
jgi:hypothetical protein